MAAELWAEAQASFEAMLVRKASPEILKSETPRLGMWCARLPTALISPVRSPWATSHQRLDNQLQLMSVNKLGPYPLPR